MMRSILTSKTAQNKGISINKSGTYSGQKKCVKRSSIAFVTKLITERFSTCPISRSGIESSSFFCSEGETSTTGGAANGESASWDKGGGEVESYKVRKVKSFLTRMKNALHFSFSLFLSSAAVDDTRGKYGS